jgi:hypothetical protein
VGSVKERARGYACLVATFLALKATVRQLPGFVALAASAPNSTRPPEFNQVRPACRLVWESLVELRKGLREVGPEFIRRHGTPPIYGGIIP